jgi:uncharacterized protein (DUF111 family)
VALTCYLDAFSGIGGDLTVGALAKRGGIGANKYRVAAEETSKHRHLPRTSSPIEGNRDAFW